LRRCDTSGKPAQDARPHRPGGAAREVTMDTESGVLGGPEPDEGATDDLGGSDPQPEPGVFGSAEPAESATDVLGGAEADDQVLGGPEPDESATDLLGGANRA
jgi:hypothetical protein